MIHFFFGEIDIGKIDIGKIDIGKIVKKIRNAFIPRQI